MGCVKRVSVHICEMNIIDILRWMSGYAGINQTRGKVGMAAIESSNRTWLSTLRRFQNMIH